MSLTNDEIAFVATRGQWTFEVLYPETGANGDWTTFVGSGLADINSFIGRYETTPTMRVQCDVGTLTSSLMDATISDCYAIREVFIATYGSVNRISPFPAGQEFPTVFQIGTKWIENPHQPDTYVT